MTSPEDGSRGADRNAAAARPTAPMTGRLVLLTLLLGGCFSEVGVEPGDGGQTGGTSCVEGAVGCECYGNGTCDPGLACETEIDRCIPEGCTPGAAACVCADGQCDEPSQCNSGVCEAPGADDHGPDDGASADAASVSDDGPAPTSGSVDDTGTSSGEDATSDASASATGPEPETGDSGGPECDDLSDCSACFDCTDAQSCSIAHDTCTDVPGCMTAVACLEECGLTGICFENCCQALDRVQEAAVESLVLCHTDHCTTACSRYEIPICN